MVRFSKLVTTKLFYFAFSVTLILLSHLYTIFFFPPTEGWWQVYGYLYNKGLVLYQDFNLPFPPLFVIYNAVLMKLSSYYMFYRIAGLAQVIAIFFIMYLSVRKLYGEKISVFAALFGVLMSMYNVVYIPNDYHTAVNLFIIISLYFLLDFYDVFKGLVRRAFSGFLMSFFLVGTFFLKQNIGLVLIVAFLVGSAAQLLINKRKRDGYLFSLFVASLFLSYLFYMVMFGVSIFDILSLTVSNDSKGGIVTVLTRIFVDDRSRELIVKGGLYFFLLFLVYPWVKDKMRESYPDLVWIIEIVLFLLISIVFFRDVDDASVVIVIIYLYLLVYLFFIRKKYSIMLFPVLALVYANSMTAGLCVGGLFIVMPFALSALFSSLISDYDRVRFEYLYYPFIGALFLSLLIYKQKEPYNWWGLRQGAVSQAKFDLPYEQLKYFKVDEATYQLFLDVRNEINEKSRSSDDVYLYPDMPIFYQLHDKLPVTKNIVQWFDVISSDQYIDELSQIKIKKPRLVIMLDPPWYVYKGHSDLKQTRLLQLDFIKYMDSLVSRGVYRLVKYQVYNNELFGDNVNDEDFIGMITVVRSPEVVGKTLGDLHELGVLKDNLNVYAIISDSSYVESVESHKLCLGDQIFVYLKYVQINDFICTVGTPDISNNKEYVLRIYELSEL